MRREIGKVLKRNRFGEVKKREREQRTKREKNVSESKRGDWKEKEKNREDGRILVSSWDLEKENLLVFEE